MQPVSRLLIRNAGRFDDGRPALWCDPPADDGWAELHRLGVAPTLHCSSWASHRAHQAAGANSRFGCVPDGPFEGHVILTPPRGKDRLAMLLDAVAAGCMPGATVWLAGENRAGIRSCEPLLAERFEAVRRVDAARKCLLLQATGAKPGRAFDLENHVREWAAECGDRQLRIASVPGVFAHGRLDDGTALLLPVLAGALPSRGRFVDVGSGCGVIGACLAAGVGAREAAPRDVTLVDDDALAVFASARTLALNGLAGQALASDGLDALDGRFDAVVSNPPFHQGVRADVELTPRLFAGLPRRLRPGGVLLLVVNRHLPYGRWLERDFATCDTLVENGTYRVVRAVRPR